MNQRKRKMINELYWLEKLGRRIDVRKAALYREARAEGFDPDDLKRSARWMASQEGHDRDRRDPRQLAYAVAQKFYPKVR